MMTSRQHIGKCKRSANFCVSLKTFMPWIEPGLFKVWTSVWSWIPCSWQQCAGLLCGLNCRAARLLDQEVTYFHWPTIVLSLELSIFVFCFQDPGEEFLVTLRAHSLAAELWVVCWALTASLAKCVRVFSSIKYIIKDIQCHVGLKIYINFRRKLNNNSWIRPKYAFFKKKESIPQNFFLCYE